MPYLPATVSSILVQSYRDFEFVIADNASTDGSRDFLRSMAERDLRIRLFFNESNLGHSGGLNRGLAECRAPWVARIDADDIALPERLERQLNFVSENKDVKLTSCLAWYIDPTGRRVGKTEHPMVTREIFQRYMATNEAIGLLHPGAFFYRDMVQLAGGYREPFGAANDIDLWARIAETGTTILVQQERLMEYRVHPGAISADYAKARMKYEWARACMVSRRTGNPEPTWDAFTAQWDSVPLLQKFNRTRKTFAKAYYRQAGLDFVCGRKLYSLARLFMASMLQPSYALRRVTQQRLR
jgi:glycosyltransferase involved in cell wall biosynthesis